MQKEPKNDKFFAMHTYWLVYAYVGQVKNGAENKNCGKMVAHCDRTHRKNVPNLHPRPRSIVSSKIKPTSSFFLCVCNVSVK